ncbi:MAG: hypothetical protein ABDH59_09055, partial [Fervidobacterium sp.]
MSKISINRCINLSLIAVCLLISYALIIIGFIAFESFTLEKLHKSLRFEFTKINDVIAGRSTFDSLVKYMKKYNYDYSNYLSYLQNYLKDPSQKELLIAEIRNFANYLKDFENMQIEKHNRKIRLLYILLILISSVIVFFLFRSMHRVVHYIKKILKKVDSISNNVYVSLIPIEEPEFQEDIKLINSIYNINLIQSIYDIFKHSQLTTSIEDFIYT